MTDYPSAPHPDGRHPEQPGPGGPGGSGGPGGFGGLGGPSGPGGYPAAPVPPAGQPGRPSGPYGQAAGQPYGSDAHGPQGPQGQPVCPRHPDRVSFVRCQRCGRPACPQCQRQAPVGVHCVDCVRAAQKQTRPQRTVLGGRVTASAHPVVTQVLIGVNVLLFLLGYVVPSLTRDLMFAPFIGEIEPWRIVTSGFLHAGIFHIAFNMYALWIVGPFLEKMLGRWRFIALYFLSLIGGSLAVVMLAGGPQTDSWYQGVVGASGAVFGLFGAIALVLRSTGRNAQQILVVIGINVVLSFIVAGISWQAHLGGLVTGGILGLLFTKLPREHQHTGGIIGVVAVTAALVAGFLAMYAIK